MGFVRAGVFKLELQKPLPLDLPQLCKDSSFLLLIVSKLDL